MLLHKSTVIVGPTRGSFDRQYSSLVVLNLLKFIYYTCGQQLNYSSLIGKWIIQKPDAINYCRPVLHRFQSSASTFSNISWLGSPSEWNRRRYLFYKNSLSVYCNRIFKDNLLSRLWFSEQYFWTIAPHTTSKIRYIIIIRRYMLLGRWLTPIT